MSNRVVSRMLMKIKTKFNDTERTTKMMRRNIDINSKDIDENKSASVEKLSIHLYITAVFVCTERPFTAYIYT